MMKFLYLAGCVLLAAAGPLAAQSGDSLRLSLGDAARLAARQNAQVLQAAARLDQARAGVGIQRSALLPHLSAEVAQSAHTLNTATFGLEFPTAPGEEPPFDPHGEVIGPVRLSDVRGRLTQTLFDWSAVNRVRSAQAEVAAGDAQLRAVGEQVGLLAAQAYVQALRARHLYASRQADVALARELLDMARQQLASGTGVRLDVTRAEAQLATVNAQLVAARSARDRAQLALARALGLPLDAAIVLTDSIPSVDAQTVDPAAALNTARAQRAELQALAAEIRARELQGAAIRAERLPSLQFVGGDGWIGSGWDHLLHTYDWALQVSVPVFQGLRTRAQAQQQTAQVAELEARRRDFEQQLAFEVRAAILDLEGAQEQVTAAAARLRLAEQEVADARARYESGVAGTGDVVTASLRLNEARTAHSEAVAAYQAARVALAAAEGNVTELP